MATAYPGGHQVNPGGHRDADFSWHLDGHREDKPPSQEAAVLLVAAWVRREKPADRGVRLAFLVAAWLQRSKEKSTYLLLLDVLLRGTVVLAGLRAVVAELVVHLCLLEACVAFHLFF